MNAIVVRRANTKHISTDWVIKVFYFDAVWIIARVFSHGDWILIVVFRYRNYNLSYYRFRCSAALVSGWPDWTCSDWVLWLSEITGRVRWLDTTLWATPGLNFFDFLWSTTTMIFFSIVQRQIIIFHFTERLTIWLWVYFKLYKNKDNYLHFLSNK